RERDDLDIEAVGRELARGGERPVAAAVVDIDHLGGEPAAGLQRTRDLEDAPVQCDEIVCLVEQGNHDGKAGIRPAARARGCAADSTDRIWRHRTPLSPCPPAERLYPNHEPLSRTPVATSRDSLGVAVETC